MNSPQKASPAAFELIERFEGFRRSAAQLDDGRWTIGYGHTKFARPGLQVSEDQAETFLRYDLELIAEALNERIYTPLTQNQFDALAAFVFNIGVENFRHSGVLRRINEGQLLQAACAMEMWRRADFEGERIVIDALVRRRAAEKALFLTPPDGFLPAPTQILVPQMDGEFAGAVPAQKPVEVSAPMNGSRAIAERIGPLEDYRPLVSPADEAPRSASEVAAEAVISRLQAINTEEPALEASPEPELGPEPVAEMAFAPAFEPEPEPEQDFELTPLAAEPEPEPAADVFDAPEQRLHAEPDESAPLFPAEPLSFDDYDSQRVAHHEFDMVAELDEVPVERLHGINPVVAWLGVMVLGLIIFAAAIVWGFNSKQMLIAWTLGILGIGCVASAVYFLLERLGGREEQ